MRVLDTDGREVRRRTRARHAGKYPAVVAIRERKGTTVPAVFGATPGLGGAVAREFPTVVGVRRSLCGTANLRLAKLRSAE